MTQERAGAHGSSQLVRAARRGEAALLGDVLADAFAEDPVFAWLIPPQRRGRDKRLRTFFTSMSRGYLRQGKPCYLTDDASAGALWAPPGALGHGPTIWRMWREPAGGQGASGAPATAVTAVT